MDKKSLVSISDLSKEEIVGLLNKAAEFEKNPNQRILQGKVVATLFFEPSTRTRLSFETAVNRLRFRALKGQVLTGHIAVLAVRSSHLIPAGCGFIEYDNLATLFVLAQDAVIRARAGAQVQRPAFRGDLINLHVVGAGLVLLGDQAHARCHGGGHRCSQNAAFRKSRPFAALVNVMHQRKLPLAVQRFGHGAAHGHDRAKAIVGKVCAVGRIDANYGQSPLSAHTKSARPEGGR